MDRTTRPLVVIAAFACSLVVALVVVLWLLGGLRGVTAPGRDRRAVSAYRPGRANRHRKKPAGKTDADLLRLHALPGCVPDLAVRNLRGAARDGQGRRPGQRVFYLGRSGARHRSRDEGLPVELRSASEGPERRSGGWWRRWSPASGSMPRRLPLKDGDYTMDHTDADLSDGSRWKIRGAVQPQADA